MKYVKDKKTGQKIKYSIISAPFVIACLSLVFYLVLKGGFEGPHPSEVFGVKTGVGLSDSTKQPVKDSEEGPKEITKTSKGSKVKADLVPSDSTNSPVKVSEGAVTSAKPPKIADVRPNVRPLDLSRPPTTEELMAAGQLGGLLYPTYDINSRDLTKTPLADGKIQEVAKRIDEMNLSFGKAIQEWNRHNYKKAVTMFRQHVADYPESPWASEAILHVGCDARYNGRYSEAEESFRQIIESNRDNDYVGAQMLKNKARLRLGVLKVVQNNFKDAEWQFSGLKTDSISWRDRTYASHWVQRISRYEAEKEALLKCGLQALAYVMKKDGKGAVAGKVMEIVPTSIKGQNLQELKTIAAGYGYNLSGIRLTIPELKDIPLPAIVQINGRSKGDSGHYWVLEKLDNNALAIFDPQSGSRFHQTSDEFSKEWSGNALVFSNKMDLPGIRLDDGEMGRLYGGCCGGGNRNSASGCGDCGAPSWQVNMKNMNLFVSDTPMWYSSPVGPSVRIRVSYNSQSAIARNEPFGNKWQFNYGSYLVVDTGDNVTIYMPDGRRDVYTPDGLGGYNSPYSIHNKLTRISENHFELRFPDDTVYIYDIPSGTNSLQPFLVEEKDAYGQSLTFRYNSNVELTTITDPMGRDTTLTYDANGLVTQVTDPFGRSTVFEYDINRNLTKITDMGGYWSTLTYDADVYLTSIENERGTWTFYIEPADGLRNGSDPYPPPGGGTWENYRITITDPLGGKEEYHYNAYSRYSWYVSPRYYTNYIDYNTNNFRGNVPKTRYDFNTTASGKGEITKITYPEGNAVSYGYDSNGNLTTVTDPHRHITRYRYNDSGRITSVTDAKGNVTNITYASNGIDLITIQNGLGIVTMAYNETHDITSITDRLGNKTAFAYNSFGQITSRTDAEGVLDIVTNYMYDSGNLLLRVSRDGSTTDRFTYDTIGRVATYTDATGLTKSYEYNNLNNVTKISYPDGMFVTYTYSGCCPHLVDSVTDRSGRATSYVYDALKRLAQTTDIGGRVTRYVYDEDGNMVQLIDPMSNITAFGYDLDNRLVKKSYADGKSTTFSYDSAGLLETRINARGIVSDYGYDANHNRTSITYSDDTHGVTYQYDDDNRVTTREDGIGLYSYGYDDNSQRTTVNGPWTNDTITYQYDELGRVKDVIPQGGQTVSYTYDDLDKLLTIQVGTNSYAYSYEVSNPNPLVQGLTRPNGSVTTYQYDTLNRLVQISNKNSSSEIINQYDYIYNQQDVRSSATITNGNPITTFQNEIISYDNAQDEERVFATAQSVCWPGDG
ncbi:MAG: hypothetical protein D8M57_03055 [Candidatus Scalindua sp. AMX11]|nr:MAG: hypothetical protein DWQ00_16935 [Candidatus Scalindua sp.]NOG85844.1 hypothetical protein [Planctomycetota bacterium]RZV96984.1 MAG: hypothetical protein EX341_02015 [Candidatus Scalindua sp. SCAELEC01]TDE66404.1 MAG: hypothetical protein D8M57_03055 [Candidatus Scalindua sp. AMX11]GJQ58205.1 MAG: hypothetical protein SCALA701_10060 [Candidatus Scalindua sp.]